MSESEVGKSEATDFTLTALLETSHRFFLPSVSFHPENHNALTYTIAWQ